MNWEAISAVSELIGSVVVLATLAYVAVQVRHSRIILEENKKIALSQVYQARSDTRRNYQLHISDSTYLAELLGRIGSNGVEDTDWDTITEEDKVRLRAHFSVIYFHQENNLYQFELDLLDDKTYKLTLETIEKFKPTWKMLNITGTGTIEDCYKLL